MSDLNQLQTNIVRSELPKNKLRDINILFSDDFLQQKLHDNGLTAQDFTSGFNIAAANQNTQYNLTALYNTLQAFKQPEAKNLHFQPVKSLIEAATTAVNQEVPLSLLLQAIQQIEIKGLFKQTKSKKYQLFLTQILFESLHISQSAQLEYLLYHDAVTNLPSTQLLISRMQELIFLEATFSLASIKFLLERNTARFIETEYSAISAEIVTVLKHALPEKAELYQSSALQFEVLILQALNHTQFTLLAAKIQRSFEHVLKVEHQNLLIAPKMGGVVVDEGMSSAEEILQQSRLALTSGIQSDLPFELYSEEHSTKLINKKALEAEVIRAFNQEELELYFQPIVSLPSETCVGAEVLLRWPNATTKGLYPSQIIEILNQVGMGKLLTRWLVNSVCRMLKELHVEHHIPVYLTLNLRAEDLNDLELPHLISQATDLWQVSPELVVLEITEEGILVYNDTTALVIAQLVECGFKLALDDFGTGYSSLARLKTMPISLVKIDQTFIRNIHESPDDFKIVGSMAQLATSLGKEVLVEGIETAEALALINQLNIPKAQGYYFAKPMPFQDYIVWAKPRLAKS
jgi:diguanylate cyclase